MSNPLKEQQSWLTYYQKSRNVQRHIFPPWSHYLLLMAAEFLLFCHILSCSDKTTLISSHTWKHFISFRLMHQVMRQNLWGLKRGIFVTIVLRYMLLTTHCALWCIFLLLHILLPRLLKNWMIRVMFANYHKEKTIKSRSMHAGEMKKSFTWNK